ncbi:MAG: type II toxin-antitoxin system VapC family toxin [Candidatus Sigynarchaeota archaeon]
MFLLDTNVFLEILLGQTKAASCKKFIIDNEGDLIISDYTIHSIGIILFKSARQADFKTFLDDVRPAFTIATVPATHLEEVIDASKIYGLDFDDAYQVVVAKASGASIVTMDQHFSKVKNIPVIFL